MRKWLIGMMTISSIVFYQNCSGRHENIEGVDLNSSNSTTIDDVDMALSLVAYERTLFPITQEDGACHLCHGVNQQPLHSVPESEIAHDVMISFGLVNLRDPDNSEIVQKLEGGHNGFDQAFTDRVRQAVRDWSDELIANGGLVGVGDGVQPIYSSLFTNVFEPKCVQCHSPGNEAETIDYSDYLTTINTGRVVPGSAGSSGLFIHTSSGAEPRGGVERLTPEEQAALGEWINRGALNN